MTTGSLNGNFFTIVLAHGGLDIAFIDERSEESLFLSRIGFFVSK